MRRVNNIPRHYPPTRVTGQQEKIVDGSPLAIIGIYVAVLRERFSQENSPDPDQWLWIPDIEQSKIVIESAYEDNSLVRDKQPAIYIDKDQSAYGKNTIGDRVDHNLRNSRDIQTSLSTVPVIIECTASRKGESAILGDIVQWTLHASSDVIQKTFGLHDMSPPILGRTVPYEMDTEVWNTQVSFQVQYHVTWSYVPIAPLLQSIVAKIEASGMDTTEYFQELALHFRETVDDLT